MASGYSFDRPSNKLVPGAPPVDASGNRTDGPTIEEYVGAGYQAAGYPPRGWAKVDSIGLTAYEAWLANPHDAELQLKAAIALGIATGEIVHGKGTPIPPAPVVPNPAAVAAAHEAIDAPVDTPPAATEDEAADLGRPVDAGEPLPE